ncbi:integrase_H2C2 domain-containing protein [Trichonephila clavata]|uniref:Integrase_H2C2 domain-containing protein n=1 Tax=Trichonephila clavata TaxID=2740835 RepID=A0A8X6M4T7_TRICU|nr:integrase_H2C2 domain-containing protein [Trichonephila clavata]
MGQQIAELLKQNQELIRALQIRDHSSSHKNVPIANRAKVFASSLSEKLYQLLKNLLAPDIPSDQTLDKLKDALKKHLTLKPLIIPSRHEFLNRKQNEGEGVQYKNQKVNLNLYIVKENLDTILGREWLYKIHLDWPVIKAIRAKTEQNLNNLLREYKDIFDDKLGEIRNYEAKLKLRPGVKPIFCRVRTVPFALKDILSRLPKTSEELEVKDDITIFQMSQIEALPVTSKELRQETGKDIELGPLLKALREGKDLQGREAQYTIEDGCITYGQRVCIPRKFQKNVLEELYAGHLGIVKMKAIARSFVYWKI